MHPAARLHLLSRQAALDLPTQVGHVLGLQQVGFGQLAQYPQHIVLRRRVIALLLDQLAPQPIDRELTIKPAHDLVSTLVDPVKAATRLVVQHIPELATRLLTCDADLGPQVRLERGHPEPLR